MYLNHADLSKYWALDAEGDLIPSTRLWVIRVQNVAHGEALRFVDQQSFQTFLAANRDAIWVIHNGLSYDVPTINRIWGTSIPLARVVDTLVLSYLYDPHMPGGHSMEAWGERFGLKKSKFSDFSQYSPELEERCRIDVEILVKVFKALTRRMRERGFSEKSCELEHQIRVVLNKQEENGFYFDRRKAEALYGSLRESEGQLGESIHRIFPPVLTSQGTYQYRVRGDGKPYASYLKHLERYPKIEFGTDGTYEVFDYEEFNIGSPVQRLERLLKLGFKPTKKTKNGNPSVDEDSLVEFAEKSGIPEVQAIADWLVVNGRANMINTWLQHVGPDSRIHGKVFTCGALTRRMTHASPNTANIPGNKARFGAECRSLWSVEDTENRRLVGYDAKALEMRCFGHYLNNPEAARLYIEGDPHTVNANLLGVTRDQVKTIFYAFLYGASDGKLASTVGDRANWGADARAKLLVGTPGLEDLVAECQAEQATGFIRTIDGGYVRCNSPHAALNSKLQSAGGIVMKQASIFIDQRVVERGMDSLKVGDIHDEGQHDTDSREAEAFGQLAVQALRDAGEELGFSVPIDGDYKIGTNWSETH